MPRRTPLVCQHLENISRDVLDRYQDIFREYIRGRQGIYALYAGENFITSGWRETCGTGSNSICETGISNRGIVSVFT